MCMTFASATALAHLIIVAGLSIRVLLRTPPRGIAMAWILLLGMVPFLGAVIYLLIGERRISPFRTRRLESLVYELPQLATEENMLAPDARLCLHYFAHPPVAGNSMELLHTPAAIFDRLIADIDAARHSVLMEFYIWNAGGRADHVMQALVRAASRGVTTGLLVDAVGASAWWKTSQPAAMRAAGIHVAKAAPASLLRSLVSRNDMRLHRKIVAIDGRLSWTGSMNLVDPRFFKQGSGVGEWIDAMLRIEGPITHHLQGITVLDGRLDDADFPQGATHHGPPPQHAGPGTLQLAATAPTLTGDGLLQVFMAAFNQAKRELIITTPYLAPDDALVTALRAATARGVAVTIVVPARNDSMLVRYASQSYYDDMLDAGVTISQFKGGLLHTKSVTMDGKRALFGTANLDMRSLWLNAELMLRVEDAETAAAIRSLQQSYMDDATTLDAATWRGRSRLRKLIDSVFRLLAPLL